MRHFKSSKDIEKLTTPELLDYYILLKKIIGNIRKDIVCVGSTWKMAKLELSKRVEDNKKKVIELEAKRLDIDDFLSLKEHIERDLQ